MQPSGSGPGPTAGVPSPARRPRRALRIGLIALLLLAVPIGLWAGDRHHRRREARQRDEAAVRRGRIFLERGDPALALRAVDLVPGGSPVEAEAMTVRGLALVAMGLVEDSRQALERALEVGPVQPMAAKTLAAIYFSRSEPGRGLGLLRLAAEADPTDFRPWYATGDIHERLGRPAEAVKAYEEALRRFPDDRGSLVGLTRSRIALGRLDAATAPLETLLRSDPEDPEVLGLAARHAFGLGDLDAALRFADRGLALDPSRADLLRTRAQIHRTAGRPDEALDDAEAAVRLAPNDLGALALLAMAESAAGLPDRAAATSARRRELADRLERMHDLTDQIQARPEDPEPRWRLGVEAAAAGERTLAEQSFRAALAIDPSCPPALAGLARLEGRGDDLPNTP